MNHLKMNMMHLLRKAAPEADELNDALHEIKEDIGMILEIVDEYVHCEATMGFSCGLFQLLTRPRSDAPLEPICLLRISMKLLKTYQSEQTH